MKNLDTLEVCEECAKIYDKEDVKRSYGKESSVYHGRFCSAKCYTKNTLNIKEL